jgi:hypothetical protein
VELFDKHRKGTLIVSEGRKAVDRLVFGFDVITPSDVQRDRGAGRYQSMGKALDGSGVGGGRLEITPNYLCLLSEISFALEISIKGYRGG